MIFSDGIVSFHLCNAKIIDNQGRLKDFSVIGLCYDFQMRQVEWFKGDWEDFMLRRTLGRELTPGEKAAFSRTDYWDGEKWVQQPTESSRYLRRR